MLYDNVDTSPVVLENYLEPQTEILMNLILVFWNCSNWSIDRFTDDNWIASLKDQGSNELEIHSRMDIIQLQD